MGDDKTKRDGRDRSKLNKDELYEIYPEAKKLGVTKTVIIDAIEKVGPNRKAVEEYVKKNNK